MTKRNPLEEIKKKYFHNLKIRKIHPVFFYHECIKCKNEFCRETMYECQEDSIYFSWFNYYVGCNHCFNSKSDFLNYLEQTNKICSKNNFFKYK